MLTIGQQHDITFKVSVMGTGAEPSAKLVIGTHPELSFPAKKVGDLWHANLRIPADMEAGTYPLRVEVVINNRHFTPLVKQVELAKAAEHGVKPKSTKIDAPREIKFTATVPPQDEAQPQVQQPRISIIQMVADRENPVTEAAAIPLAPASTSKTKAKPVVSLAGDQKPIKKTASPKKLKPVIEFKAELPVKLVKGDIIYE